MHRGAALFEGGERIRKADHQAAFERPEHNAAGVLGCNQGGRRHDVQIAESPRFLLNLLDRVMLRLALDIANVEVPTVNVPFKHNVPPLFSTRGSTFPGQRSPSPSRILNGGLLYYYPPRQRL